MKSSLRTILAESLPNFRRTWPQLFFSDLLGRILAIVVLTPIVGLLLKFFLATTPTGVVTDGAIVSFLLHPAGLAALLFTGALSLGIVLIETGQLMVIWFGAIEDRRVTWLDALRYVFRRVGAIVHLAWYAIVRLLFISMPFLAAVGAVYWFLLRTYDISYYIVQKPPEFIAAIAIAGLLLTVLAIWFILRIAGWLLALPMVLFEGLGGRQAMRASEETAAAHRRKIALWLVEWIAAVVLLSALVTFVIVRIGNILVPRDNPNLTLLLVVLSSIILLSGLANLAVTMFSTVMFPLLVLRLFHSIAGPGELKPEIAARGTLGEKASFSIPGKKILWAAAVVLVVIVVSVYLAMRNREWKDHVQIIAHRGGAAVAPENTMAAFERAIADGADWLELDVQENADGVVVVAHDRDFMRVSGNKLEVRQATNADLTTLDVGTFFDPKFSDQRVPTLREVLDLTRSRASILIELKHYGHDQSLEAKVVDLVEQAKMDPNIAFMSLDYRGIRKAQALRPSWNYGMLNAVAVGDLTNLDVNFLGLTARAASCSMIRRAHQRGMKVYVWTIDDPVQMSVMMSRGADGIITDQVALARKVKDMRAKITAFGRIVIWIAGETGVLRGVERSSDWDEM